MFRRLTFLLVSVLAAVGLFAPTASADEFSPKTICVNTDYGTERAGCDFILPYSRDGLQYAIDYANSELAKGDDTIRVDPGTIEISNSVIYTAPVDRGALHIVGAGQGVTRLLGMYTGSPGPPFTALQFATSGSPTSSISNLSIVQGGNTSVTGLEMNGGTVDNVGFTVSGDIDFSRTGLSTGGYGTTVKNSTFIVSGFNATGIFNNGHELDVTDTSFRSNGDPDRVYQYGIWSTGSLIGRRLKFADQETAIAFSGVQLEIYDSLFKLGATDTAVSLTPGAADGNFLLQGVTVVGSAPNQVGVKLVGSTHTLSGDVRESLFDLNGAGSTEISCVITGGGAVSSLYILYSMYAPTAGGCLVPSLGNQIRSGSLQPAYKNAAASDYRPAAGSPVVDAGNPVAYRPFDPKLDLGGLQRFIDGNGDGSAITDIGAYEFQPEPPTLPGGGGGATTTPPVLSIKFGKPVGKFKVKSKPKAFKLGTKKTKPRLPIISSAKLKIKLTLKKGKKKVKGSQSITIPAGASYLTFTGKFAGKKLKPGKYTLHLTAPGLKDSPKSVLNLIR
ncbi:MAG: choice-of-anchor Q domain-containing protein [Solirubrobacterales bacterium]